jgi:hypothetical protein
MIGVIFKKYHIAVLDDDINFITKMVSALKLWYDDKVVIESFDNPRDMFEAVHISEVNHKPFDFAVLSPNEEMEKLVLRQSNPSLKVILCKDENSLKSETSKIFL